MNVRTSSVGGTAPTGWNWITGRWTGPSATLSTTKYQTCVFAMTGQKITVLSHRTTYLRCFHYLYGVRTHVPILRIFGVLVFVKYLILSALVHSFILINPSTPVLNPSAQRCLTRFLLGILLLEPCISLICVWKTNKYTNYSFSLLIMYGTSYMFRHYIAIFRELS
jgi:hypothetical protein